ncbi:DUF3781 domain-containing protein [Companilactobacillus versmoldensis]|uniref:DUF3781 domain-containing protein n=1 Tax=Companilactobacillus versmoldensis TaxID=194326 RepID=UPI000977D031
MLPEIIKNIKYNQLVYEHINKKLGTNLTPKEIEKRFQITLHCHDCKVSRKDKSYYVTCKSQ